MKLQSYRAIDPRAVAGVPETARGWLSKLLEPLNSHLKQLTTLLQGQGSADNLNEETRDLLVLDEVPFDVTARKVRGPIEGVELLWHDPAGVHAELSWEPVELGRVRVTVFCWLLQTERLPVRILLRGK